MDAHPEILNWVEADIQRKNLKATGRSGMTIESILRSGFLLGYWQWTYDDLAFHLMDWVAQATHYVPLIERIIDQACRRAVKGENVPAAEKVVSLFEEHTDIIVKDKRCGQFTSVADDQARG